MSRYCNKQNQNISLSFLGIIIQPPTRKKKRLQVIVYKFRTYVKCYFAGKNARTLVI